MNSEPLNNNKRDGPVWTPIILSGIAILISVGAFIVSGLSYCDSRKLSKLDLRPSIRLQTQFKPVGKIPPHFTVINKGPIDAVQVQVEMYRHCSRPDFKRMTISKHFSMHDKSVKKLEPGDQKSFKFIKSSIEVDDISCRPLEPENNILEIKITYRHPQDLERLYDESAFYFVNPEGSWVNERSSSVTSEKHEAIKALVQKIRDRASPVWDALYDWEMGYDTLLPNKSKTED
jgi:hypothetical protein